MVVDVIQVLTMNGLIMARLHKRHVRVNSINHYAVWTNEKSV
jgi:hypothetical protein